MTTVTQLIGTAEAAELLGMNRFTLIRYANSGRIPFVGKAPGKRGALLFSRTEVERLARERAA